MKIKICGLSRREDVTYVNQTRPDWCGFVIDCPKSRRNVSGEQAAALRAELAPGIVPVGVFVDRPVDQVAGLLLDGTIAVAQLHGGEDEGYLAALRDAAPGCVLWRAFRVRSREDLVSAAASSADLVVLDNGAGTGQVFDWSLLKGFPRPYLLAGGLTPDNLPQAAALGPFGVDLSSGVETDGKKDEAKILAAVAAARRV